MRTALSAGSKEGDDCGGVTVTGHCDQDLTGHIHSDEGKMWLDKGLGGAGETEFWAVAQDRGWSLL